MERISIFICVPEVAVNRIYVNLQDKISTLAVRFPVATPAYIMGKMTLNSEYTFQYYNIKQGDVMVIVDSVLFDKDPKQALRQWASIIHDSCEMQTRIQWLLSNNLNREYSRLKDLTFLQLEGRKKIRHQLQRCLSVPISRHEKVYPTVLGSVRAPSTEPLPLVWNPLDFSA